MAKRKVRPTAMKQPQISRTLKKHRENGYVTLAEIADQDAQLRIAYNLPPRASRAALCDRLCKAKIRRIAVHRGLSVYHEQDAVSYLTNLYSHPMKGNWACKGYGSRARSHLHATPAIIADSDFLPLRRASQIANVNPARVGKWVQHMQILPYWDATAKCLLYSVTELKRLAPWRQYNTIVRHLGSTAAEKIKATRQKKIIAGEAASSSSTTSPNFR